MTLTVPEMKKTGPAMQYAQYERSGIPSMAAIFSCHTVMTLQRNGYQITPSAFPPTNKLTFSSESSNQVSRYKVKFSRSQQLKKVPSPFQCFEHGTQNQ